MRRLLFSSIISLLFFSACSDYIFDPSPIDPASPDAVSIVAHSSNMCPVSVGTRAAKEPTEISIKNQHLFIFGSDGNLLKVKPEFITNGKTQAFQSITNGSFIIDRIRWTDEANALASSAEIYILANVSDISDIPTTTVNGQVNITKATLEAYCAKVENGAAQFDTNAGIPMFGKYNGTINLANNSGIDAKEYNIELKALLSRIDVTISFLPVDKNPNNSNLPSFRLINYDILNLPKNVKLTQPTEGNPTPNTSSNPSIETFDVNGQASGAKTLRNGEKTSFTFYVGEKWRYKSKEFSELSNYPSNFGSMTATEQEKYKMKNKNQIAPADDDAVKLVIHGIYTTPEGQGITVDYTIYLGENHTDSFILRRNFNYRNVLEIKGYNQYDDGTNGVEVDHRVELSYEKLFIQSERRTEIDCHWEMRPVDITLVNSGTTVTAEILTDPTTGEKPDWVGMEKRSTDDGNPGTTYLYGGNGRRKYFTTDLVSSLNTGTITINNNDDNRIWLYFDQNNTVSQKGTRQCTVRFTYNDSKNPTQAQQIDMVFVQHDQCPVNFSAGGTNYQYAMETHEEYLYNFDPKDNYGVVTDGMPWGYHGEQFSYQDQAVPNTDIKLFGFLPLRSINVAEKANAYYDFDNRTTQDGAFVSHTYSGRDFTSKLIAGPVDNNKQKKTAFSYAIPAKNGVPRSAAEYCYNKNYRNENGEVERVEWYLPAVDEIEPLLISGFNSFPELQGNYYWSSQPSYLNLHASIFISLSWLYGGDQTYDVGKCFLDDMNYARATKITSVTPPIQSESSLKDSYEGKVRINLQGRNGDYVSTQYSKTVNNADVSCNVSEIPRINSGPNTANQPRTAINRVRCVRRISPEL